ncbi:MAG: hypothetical protein L6R38_003437 [Xanthoria sp. 2 TBL-2021]|nr:MAG: hypothetical protein L6R38_003437 [Xanthoria sp. 2 TBL-2021]
MRVRKAVPEGYKTKRLSENPIPVLRDSRPVYGMGSCNGYAELVPYCGISKIGGYMAQECSLENGNDALGSGMFFEEEDDGLNGIGVPSLSGESVLIEAETAGHGGGLRSKRLFIEYDENEEEEVGVECAGRHNASSGIVSMEGPIALRPIAQARNRPRDVTSKLKGACDGDFGEAPFLRDLQEDMEFGDLGAVTPSTHS